MNRKMMAGIGLAVGIVVIAFLAASIQAYVNGNQNGNVLQTQTQERLKTQDCNCDMLRMQEQKRLGTQHCDCSCDCIQTQNRNRQRAGEYVTNGTCVQTINMRQFRNQHREVTRSQGG